MPALLNTLRLLALSLVLTLALPATAGGLKESDLNAQKELLQKDIDALGKRIDSVDKRIDDQVNRVADVGSAVDRFGILVTVILAFAGLVGYVSAANRAREEARKASEQWLNENFQKLQAQIQELEHSAAQARTRIDNTVDGFNTHVSAAKESLQKAIDSTHGSTAQIRRTDDEALQQSAEQIKAMPEANYSFEDWNTRAFAAYQAEQREDAVLYWKRAAAVPGAGAARTAQALLNRGIVLVELERSNDAKATYQQLIDNYINDPSPKLREIVVKALLNKGAIFAEIPLNEESIATYNLLIDRYSGDNTPAIREQVLNAMLNKAITLGEMQRNEESIATYNLLIDGYSDDSIPSVREQIAKALLSKGITLGKMQRDEESIAVYSQLIDHYSDDNTPAIRATIADAMNSRGFTYLITAKKNWSNSKKAKDLLGQATADLQAALERNPADELALGNLAYVCWLHGKTQEAEDNFRAALASNQDGCEKLHKDTLDDIAQHTIPEDIGFRELVERLWAEYQGKPPANPGQVRI